MYEIKAQKSSRKGIALGIGIFIVGLLLAKLIVSLCIPDDTINVSNNLNQANSKNLDEPQKSLDLPKSSSAAETTPATSVQQNTSNSTSTTTPSTPTTTCNIKGNISSKGERIYHVPGQRYYNATKINTGAGERWFCTEQEAIAAGWRKSKV